MEEEGRPKMGDEKIESFLRMKQQLFLQTFSVVKINTLQIVWDEKLLSDRRYK